jgi:hypothetical protein
MNDLAIDVVGHDHAVVDRPQPAGHDDADAAGVVQAADLLGQRAADRQPFELGAETGAGQVLGVVLERLRRGRLDMIDPLAAAGDVFFQGVERGLDQVLLARLVLFLGQIGPVFVPGVGAGDDQAPRLGLGPRARVVEREGAAGDVAAQQQIGAETRAVELNSRSPVDSSICSSGFSAM